MLYIFYLCKQVTMTLAAFERFDVTKHGGSPTDTPDGHILFHWYVDCEVCYTVAMEENLTIGRVKTYKWKSPLTKTIYTLCVPVGIISFQKWFRKRLLRGIVKRLDTRQRIGKKYPLKLWRKADRHLLHCP
jgi:hypothetical protein